MPDKLEEARIEVQALLTSGLFTPTSRQAKLLEFLFEKVSQGQMADLKEYTIAVELFHKPDNFDQHSDATVRVEAHRLRKKLEKYYENEGLHHPLRVVLPPGHYVLQFLSASTAPATALIARTAKTGDLGESGNKDHSMSEVAAPLRRYPWRWWVMGTMAILVLLVGYFLIEARKQVVGAPTPALLPSENSSIGLPDPELDAIRILVGHRGPPYVDVSGRRWLSDRFFEGGTIRSLNREVLLRTGRPHLFQKAREGIFKYRIPLTAGEYEVRLYTAEPDNPGSEKDPERRWRIFFVRVNGKYLLTTYDLPAEVGFSADIRSFAHIRADNSGFLTLQFSSARGLALVNAIELLPMVGGKVHPIRIYAGSQQFLDEKEHLWSPDDYFSAGKISPYPAMIVSEKVDPGVLSYERYGSFEYFIPVAEGEYQVTLFFAETWFGPKNQGGKGRGSRIFDVLLNNKMVLESLDLLREAPPNQLIKKTFRHIRPDRQGKIHFTFSPQVNHATLRAIEVLPE